MDSEVYIIGRDAVPQFLRLDAGEARSMTLVVPPGTSARLGLEIDLCGPGASLDLAGVYLCNDAERVDLRVLVRHSSGGCTSRQLFKGIVGGTARAVFDGLIYVVRQDYVNRSTILDSAQGLGFTGVRFIGCILNITERSTSRYGYGYGYGRGYGYGYGYGYSKRYGSYYGSSKSPAEDTPPDNDTYVK